MQRDHQDGRIGGTRCDLFRRIQSIHSRHLEVEYDDIKLFFIEFLNSFPSIRRLIAHFPMVLNLEKIFQGATHRRIVVHDEDTDGRQWMLSA